MRKLTAVLMLIAFSCIPAFAADLDIGTHASFFLPPEGGGNTLMTGIDATYKIDDRFSARASVDTANYAANEHKYSITSLTTDLIWHTLGNNMYDPYLGCGLGYYEKKLDLDSSNSTGVHAIAGIAVKLQTFTVGIEVKYTVPDTRYMEAGYYSVGGQFQGGLHLDL